MKAEIWLLQNEFPTVAKADSELVRQAEDIVSMVKSPVGSPLFHSVKDFVDFALRLAIEKYKAEAKIVKKEQVQK